VLASLAWLHDYLCQLSDQFPAPRPLPGLRGSSVAVSDGALWELTTYLPGAIVAWSPVPTLDRLGAFLASYHAAAEPIRVAEQRPASTALRDLDRIVTAFPDGEAKDRLTPLVQTLAAVLPTQPAAPLVIHGDATAHNILARGVPPRPSGLIDFNAAHIEDPLADLACALWRTGRPVQDATRLDTGRIDAFVRGYHRVRHLPADSPDNLVVYLWGRGVQMLVRAALRGDRLGDSRRIDWIRAHQAELRDAVGQALR
jgi:Ser/Thr protein kinase RdoA (MazF antagonist)